MKTLTESILYFLNESKVAEQGNSTTAGIGAGQHYHKFSIDENGNGITSDTIPVVEDAKVEKHKHKIEHTVFTEVNDHTHSIKNRDEE